MTQCTILKKLLGAAFLGLISISAYSEQYTSTGDGGIWDDAASWTGGIDFPQDGDTATVLSGDTIILDSDERADQLTVNAGGIVDVTIDGTLELRIDLKLINNGLIKMNRANQGDTQLDFYGTSLSGTGEFDNQSRFLCRTDFTIETGTDLKFGTGEFFVNTNVDVINNGSMEFEGRLRSNGGATWTQGANSSIKAGGDGAFAVMNNGTLTASASGNTIEYNRAGNQTMKIPTSGYHNLIISGGSTKTLVSDLTVLNDFTNSATINFNTNDVTVGGNVINNGIFTNNDGSAFRINGSGAQSISSSNNFRILTIDKSAGTVTLSSNITVQDTLNLTDGILDADSYTLTLGTASDAIGKLYSTKDCHIIGKFERWVNANATDYAFPVGSSFGNHVATINFSNLTSGSIIAEFIESAPSTGGFPLSEAFTVYNPFTEGYWQLERNNGSSFTDFGVTLRSQGLVSFTPVNETRIVTKFNTDTDWRLEGSHGTFSGDSVSRTSVSLSTADFSIVEFALGDTTNCAAPTGMVISGDQDVCVNEATVGYSVNKPKTSTFSWTVTGGTIDGGAPAATDTNITVTWGATGQVGNIRVIETDACGSGAPVDLAVNIHSLPITGVTGNTEVAADATGEAYSITSTRTGYNYAWKVTGGTIASGAGTSAITVNWDGAAGVGTVLAEGTFAAECSADSAEYTVNVTKFGTITSVQSGNWNDPATWDCNCDPADEDNIVIANGDTVTLTQDETVNNININAGGVLDNTSDGTIELFVDGNYHVDGEHILSRANTGDDQLFLDGGDVTISGTGTVNNSSRIRIRNGNKTITAGTDLTFGNGQWYINGSITVTNNGSVDIGFRVGGGTNVGWTQGENAYVKFGGDGNNVFDAGTGILNATAAGNTVEYDRAGNQTIHIPVGNAYHNLTLSGGGVKSLTDVITVENNLNISSTLSAFNNDFIVKGNWNNTGSFNIDTANVTFTGTQNQTLTNESGEVFSNLIVDKTAGTLTFNADVQVTDTLWMTLGDIATGSNTLTVGENTIDFGTLIRAGGNVIGNYEKYITATGTDYTFPIGVGSNDRSVILNFTNLSVGGSVEVGFTGSAPGNSGLPITDGDNNAENTFSDGYWTLTRRNSLTTNDFNLKAVAGGFTAFSLDGSNRVLSRTTSEADWQADGTHVVNASDTAVRNNMTFLSAEIALADTTACTGPTTSEITGVANVCIDDQDDAYSVTNTGGSTYAWTVTGGTVDGGQGTNAITVDWGATGVAGHVAVSETNSCTTGEEKTIGVNVHPLPISSLTGDASVSVSSTETYSVTAETDYTYLWVVTGGTISSGQGTTSINVDWSAVEGAGTVTVYGKYTGCTSDSSNQVLNVTKFGIFSSIASGDWSSTSTWDCACVPAINDNVKISAGDTVLLSDDRSVNNVEIEATAVLDLGTDLADELSVYGDLTINGKLTQNGANTNNDQLLIRGSGNVLDGTGTWDRDSRTRFLNGSKTIASTYNVTSTGNGRFHIDNNVIVTNNGIFTSPFIISGGGVGATWIQGENSTLYAGGSTTNAILANGTLKAAAAGNTVNYNRGGDQNVKIPETTYANLILSGGQEKILDTNTVVTENLTIESVLNAQAFTLTVGGNWSNTGTFNQSNNTVVFNGTSDQDVSGTGDQNFYNLSIEKGTSTLTLTNNIIVENNFTLLSGKISTGSSQFTLGTGTGVPGTLSYTDGRFIGKFNRWVNSTGTEYLFPLGTENNYRPLHVTFTDLTSGTVEAGFNESAPGNSGLSLFDTPDSVHNTFTEGYWTLERANSAASNNYDLDLVADGFDDFTITGGTRLVTRTSSSSEWQMDGTHVAANGDTIKRTGLTLLSAEYAAGDTTQCEGPSTSAITGAGDVCVEAADEAYSVTNTGGSTYTWTITGGTLDDGQGTNAITVDWPADGVVGTVSVVENNGCTNGAAVEKTVNVHAVPITSLTGDASVSISSAETYSVSAETDYTYLWLVTGGSISSGQGTNSIDVAWSAVEGAGTVAVYGKYTSCSMDSSNQVLNVTKFGVFTSVASGDWNNSATWDCACVPTIDDNVKIAAGDTVTLTDDRSVNNVEIEATGLIDLGSDTGDELSIYGDFTNNGKVVNTQASNNNDGLFIRGSGTIMDGNGTFDLQCRTRFLDGNHTFASTCDWTFSNNGVVYINNDLIITNNGTVDIAGTFTGGLNGTIQQGATGTLKVGGVATAAIAANLILKASEVGNTVEYTRGGVQTIKTPESSYYNLTLGGSSTKSIVSDLNVDGDLSITSQLDLSTFVLNLKGNWDNQGVANFTSDNIITFEGGNEQTISSTTDAVFDTLVISKSGGSLTLNVDVTIEEGLKLQGGNLVTGSNAVTVGESTAQIGTLERTTGHIVGNLKRYLSATGTPYLFPLGTSSKYRPSTIEFNALTSGTLTMSFEESTPGVNGLSLEDAPDSVHNTFAEGYWTATKADGLESSDYDLDLTATDFNSYVITGGTRLLTRINSSSPWTANGAHQAAVDPVVSRNNITQLSAEYAVADTTPCPTPPARTIIGEQNPGINDMNVMYRVVGNDTSSFVWNPTGGTIASGQGNDTVFINWGATGMSTTIAMSENNGCAVGPQNSLDISLHPLPTSAISGVISAAKDDSTVTYSVTEVAGYLYDWSITGGSLLSDSASSITVVWQTEGTQTIYCDAKYISTDESAAQVSLEVEVYGTVESITDGAWNSTSTWSCSCVPGQNDNVIIRAGDTVSIVTVDASVNNLEIEANAAIDGGTDLAIELNVYGNLHVDGRYFMNGSNGGNTVLFLHGNNTTISGSGEIYNQGGQVQILTGNKIISSGTNLDISGSGRVVINSCIIITNNGTIEINGVTAGQAASSTWTQGENSTVKFGNTYLTTGTLNADATGNTVILDEAGDQAVKLSDNSTFYNLTLGGGGNKTLSGPITLLGDLNISSVFTVGANNVAIAGDWNNSGAYISGNNEIRFNGTGAQTLTSNTDVSLYDLAFDKPGGTFTMSGDIEVTNSLTMDQGIVDANGFTLTLGTGTGNVGTLNYVSGTIIGKYEKYMNSTTSFLLPLGTASNYRPVTITLNQITGGSLITEFVASSPGTSGLPLSENSQTYWNMFNEGYWSLIASNGLASTDYDVDITADGFSSFTIVDVSAVVKRSDALSSWLFDGTHVNASGSLIQRDALSGFGQFGLADTTQCDPPTTSAITGGTSVCKDSADAPYSVTNTGGSTYAWTVTGGAVDGGQGTNAITVDWGSTGVVGEVAVVETNSCTSGDQVTLAVNVDPVPTSSITGDTTVAEGAAGEIYTVTNNSGYKYHWYITGGTFTSNDSTNSVTVTWNTAGNQTISVVGFNTACNDSATIVTQNVEVFSTIRSVQNGDWTTPATWDCNCDPPTDANIIISAGDTVNMVADERVTNFTIEATGYLNGGTDAAIELEVEGDYLNNGTHFMNGGNVNNTMLFLDGSGTIGGTGTIESNSQTQMRNGNRTITAGSNLTITGGRFYINPNLILTNEGTIDFGYRIQGGLNAKWVQAVNSNLLLQGDGTAAMGLAIFDASATGNTVTYSRTGGQTIDVPEDGDYYNLIIAGSSAKTLGGDIIVNGDLTINSTLAASTFKTTLKGNFTNNGTFTYGTGEIEISGTSTQTLVSTTVLSLYDLTVLKSSGTFEITDNVIVRNNFTLTSGVIDLNNNKMTIGFGTSNTGSVIHTGGVVLGGTFERWIGATGTDYFFPVGISTDEFGLKLNFNNLSVAGSVEMEFIEGNPGRSGLPMTEGAVTVYNPFSEGYWDLTAANGLTSNSYNARAYAGDASSFSVIPATRLMYRTNSGANWSFEGTHVDAANDTVKRNAITQFGNIGLGDSTNCGQPTTSAITGDASVCKGDFNDAYSVVNTPGSIYNWEVTGGTVQSGTGTNAITVNWGSGVDAGEVKVTETDDCTTGDPVTLAITLDPVATSAITGLSTVSQGDSNILYFVTNNAGYTYDWTVTNGTILSGDGTDSIRVEWSETQATGNVSVVASHACGDAAAVDLAIVIEGTYPTNQDGDWDQNSTWVCNCIPPSGATVSINHKVNVVADVTVDNITIADTLDLGTDCNIELFVQGNITINGVLLMRCATATNNQVVLNTGGQIIAGNGKVDNTSRFQVSVSATIDASANLEFETGNFYMSSGAVTINNGTVTLGGDLVGANAASNWTQGPNSNLIFDGSSYAVMNTGILSAWGAGNTVTYAGTATATIKDPDNSEYYDLIISGSNAKSMSGDLEILGDFSISSGANFSPGSNTLMLKGGFTNSGTYTSGTSTASFEGSSAQVINSTAAMDTTKFYNIVINNSNGVSIAASSGQTAVLNTATLTLGTFTVDSNFIIISDGSTTGRVLGTGTGTFSGHAEIQRHGTGTVNGWRYWTSPVSPSQLWQFQYDVATTGFASSTYPSLSFVNVNTYNEPTAGDLNQGWTPATHMNNTMSLGQGFSIYMSADELQGHIDFFGEPNMGSVSFPATYTDGPDPVGDEGWNLVGNPFPGTMDWDAASGWTKTNVTTTTYIWDADALVYATYTTGSGGMNGGSRYIAMCQGFWVKGDGVGAIDLQATRAVLADQSVGFIKNDVNFDDDIVRIKIEGNGYSDEMMLHFSDDATDGFDKMDADKLKSPASAVPDIYSKDASGRPYAVNAQPLNEDKSIYFDAEVVVGKVYDLTFTGFDQLDPSIVVTLLDMNTGQTTDLRTFATYSFSAQSDLQNFVINFTTDDITTDIEDDGLISVAPAANTSSFDFVSLYPNPAQNNVKAIIQSNVATLVDVYMVDLLGKRTFVKTTQLFEGENIIPVDLDSVSDGLYFLQIETNSELKQKKFIVRD